MLYLSIVNKIYVTVTLGWHNSSVLSVTLCFSTKKNANHIIQGTAENTKSNGKRNDIAQGYWEDNFKMRCNSIEDEKDIVVYALACSLNNG